jgi:hypothetical protein
MCQTIGANPDFMSLLCSAFCWYQLNFNNIENDIEPLHLFEETAPPCASVAADPSNPTTILQCNLHSSTGLADLYRRLHPVQQFATSKVNRGLWAYRILQSSNPMPA